MKFLNLGSGSKGNSSVIDIGGNLILIDEGLAFKDFKERLNKNGYSEDDIKAIFVTHEHSDHIKGLSAILKKKRIPRHMNMVIPNASFFFLGEQFSIKIAEKYVTNVTPKINNPYLRSLHI